MEAVRQSWFHRFLWVALLVAIAVFLAYAWNWNAPQEFRGVLRYPVLAPGGETTGVVIWTQEGGRRSHHATWEGKGDAAHFCGAGGRPTGRRVCPVPSFPAVRAVQTPEPKWQPR